MYYILYNPHAACGKCKDSACRLKERYFPSSVLTDMTTLEDYGSFFNSLSEDDEIIICGGDGTLNRFVNDTRNIEIKNPILYSATGSGNDFLRDIEKNKNEKPDFHINKYIASLPSVNVNGKEYLFLNNVGFGIDGYCCEEGDRQRNEGKTDVNYTAIAIKGLLGKFKPVTATVAVDGCKHTYKNAWLVPTMNGRYYGGGMMPTPEQDRLDAQKKLSVLVFHSKSKLKALLIFPSIFSGKHIKHEKYVEILSGHDIKVEFSIPTALQIDGETILNVTSYHAKSSLYTDRAAKSDNAYAFAD